MNETIIVFGSSSTIAQAYIQELDKKNKPLNLICISRSIKANNHCKNVSLSHFETDYSKESLNSIINQINVRQPILTQAIIFNGQLHTHNNMPERKLSELDHDHFNHIMNVNALTPMMCISSLTPLLHTRSKCTITVLSARVGSIEDNKLGGWYSYRASKAALNMMLQSAAIEIARKVKKARFFSFHPGTTETELSKPFRKNIPQGKLFSPEFVAKQLLHITQSTFESYPIGEAIFLDWEGKKIPW
ncbi:SDR family NAD(P)-dependent oxidoreductase [Marinomonas sp. 2405UD68-3]|uniref:SDR family NAD(P)-dependent oxidoreductase n=1 Tax=Marinomonas sp. 2405UD68-3 TaxID=3391835 RepID=UPI0039C93177